MKAVILVLGLVLCAATVQAQTKDAKAAGPDFSKLQGNHKLALAVFDIAGATKAASNPNARYTLLLPTDAAVQDFLNKMGLTVDDLKKRPLLAKQLLAQHTLLRSNVRESEIFEKGNTRKAASLASTLFRGDNDLTFNRANGKVTVTDPQGNVANIGKPIFLDSQKTVLPIDRVLMGDDYYYTVADACKARAKTISSFCDAVKTAGLSSALSPKGGLDATVFVPNNAALAKATAAGKPSADALATILKFHVVPGARELPKQWKGGVAYPTLLDGKSVKVTYAVTTHPKRKLPYATASVEGVPILKANVHVGKTVVHGIGSVLNPSGASAAPVTTEKAAATKPAAAAAAPKPATASGRKLLQRGGGGSNWSFSAAPTAEQDVAASNIEAVAAGDESAATASQRDLLGAEELSVPGDYNQVMNGINPW